MEAMLRLIDDDGDDSMLQPSTCYSDSERTFCHRRRHSDRFRVTKARYISEQIIKAWNKRIKHKEYTQGEEKGEEGASLIGSR